MYCKILDIFGRWRNKVGSILFVLQNSWRFQTVEEVGSILFVLQNSWHFQTVEDYGGIVYSSIFDKTDSFWKWQEKPNQYSDHKVSWTRDSASFLIRILFKMTMIKLVDHIIPKVFRSEFWWLPNHLNDFWFLEELDDHGILVKFLKDLIRILFKN